MRVGIISVYTDYHRRGLHHRGTLQPQIGPLIAALLPAGTDVEIINDAWTDPDWTRDYDLLFMSCMHSDFDRARQISHYWRRRGAKTVLGGILASTYPALVAPFFDAIAVGDPESTVPRIAEDFSRNALRPIYRATAYDPATVPTPRFDLAARQQVLPISLEVTRGCPFTCDFCALTGLGTRHHFRPVERVVADILAGQRMLGPEAPWHQRRIVGFYDNNLGGNLGYLRRLCEALEPLQIYWGVCVTFNVICDADLLARMARAGCRGVFVGLESFNPAALSDMRKFQNVLGKTRAAIDQCHRHGIIVMAGLMLSPAVDDTAYMESVPERLIEAGLHVPTYVCFETPFPGTPHFQRLSRANVPAFMPGALLRDFNGYTLVTRPVHESPEDFIAGYRRLHRRVFSRGSRLRKLAVDAWRFLPRGSVMPLLFDACELLSEQEEFNPQRTFMAGTDIEPPEAGAVPFEDSDFDSEAQRRKILDPWPVSDARGCALPLWLDSARVYTGKGRVARIREATPRADDVRVPAATAILPPLQAPFAAPAACTP